MDKAEDVFHQYGETKAVVLARFIPIVRTFMNPVAGVLEMPAKKFFLANLIGGVIWADGVLLLGRLACNGDQRGQGRQVHHPDHPGHRAAVAAADLLRVAQDPQGQGRGRRR